MPDNDKILYALSTCVHCRHTREFLESLHVPFTCIYVDKLTGEERQKVVEEVKKHNPRLSFPTFVMGENQQICIVGFEPEKLEKAIKS